MSGVTYPIEMPSVSGEVRFTWSHDAANVVQTSEFTLQTRVFAWPGAQCRKAVLELAPMQLAEAKAWQAFVLKLNGQEGTFYLQDPIGNAVRGAYTPDSAFVPRVMGANQLGPYLETDGWEPSVANILLKGDYVSINDRLYTVFDDVSSDASGNCTLPIWPHAFSDLADNAEILVGEDARGLFRLVQFPDFAYDVEHYMNGFVLSVQEAR